MIYNVLRLVISPIYFGSHLFMLHLLNSLHTKLNGKEQISNYIILYYVEFLEGFNFFLFRLKFNFSDLWSTTLDL